MPAYPVEVFVAVSLLDDLTRPIYRLIRRESESICADWECSHFWTMGTSVLRYDPQLEASKAVTLCCETDPVMIMGVEPEPFTFTEPNKVTPVKLTYRVEVSSYQIRRAYATPIKLLNLADSDPGLQFMWVSEVEFEGRVFGQRSGKRVWLETDGAIKWK